jgi:glycopeptide antibiotics resistance protein
MQIEVEAGRRSAHEVNRVKYEYLLDRIVEAALFAAVVATMYAGLIRGGAPGPGAVLASGIAVHTLAGTIMLIRVFLSSRGFDSSILPCATVGWLVGLGAAMPVIVRAQRRANRRIEWPRMEQKATIALTLALIILYNLSPFDFTSSIRNGLATRAGFFPFKGLMASHPSDAFMSISGDLLRFAAMGAALAWFLNGYRLPLTLLICAIMTCCLSCVTETFHLLMPSRHCDVTHVILATIGSIGGAIGYRWVIDFQKSIGQIGTDDLLTTRLIEGASYEPIDVKSRGTARSDASPTDRVESR